MPKKERDGKVNISIWINKDTHARLVELAKSAEFRKDLKMGEKVRDFFRQNIGYFIVGFVCVIYILTAFLRIDKTGKTVSQII